MKRLKPKELRGITSLSKYLNHFVLDFLTKKNIKHYRLLKWSENGMNQSLIKTGIYNGETIQDLIPKEINSCEELK